MDQNERSITKLFAPPKPTDVLIPDENIVYNERRHWAILIQPFVETLVALVFITILAGGRPVGNLGAIVFLGATGLFLYQLHRRQWSKAIAYGGTVALLLGFVFFKREGMAVFAVLFVVGRFGYRFMMWAFYERLYITNRRVITAKAFLGSDISTMPLTRVTDISYKTTVAADLLGYGILRVESAGQDQALSLLNFLDKPGTFYNILIGRTTAAVGSVTDDADHLDEDDGSGTLHA